MHVEPKGIIFMSEGNLMRRDFGSTLFAMRSYVDETDAEMDMWMEIHQTYGKTSKEIKLIVATFRKSCLKSVLFADYRHFPGSTRCINGLEFSLMQMGVLALCVCSRLS